MLLATLPNSVGLSGFHVRVCDMFCQGISFEKFNKKFPGSFYCVEWMYGACVLWPMFTSVEYVVMK